MGMKAKQIVRGHITSLQEDRFRFTDDTGKTLLLTLKPGAKNGEELMRLHSSNAHLQVEYTGSPNTAGALAHALVPLSPDD